MFWIWLGYGSGEGVNVEFLKNALAISGMDVYVGGGVRDVKDLVELKELGVSGVLVATALHTGKITVEEFEAGGSSLDFNLAAFSVLKKTKIIMMTAALAKHDCGYLNPKVVCLCNKCN